MSRYLKVVDYTHGKRESKDVDTSIPFTKSYETARSIQQANIVIAGYVNKNYQDNIKITKKLLDLLNDISVLETDIILVNENLKDKQDKLISGTNIKTINNQDITGSGNIEIEVKNISWGNIKGDILNQEDLVDELNNIASTIPTKTSELNNDSCFITQDSVPTKTSELVNDSNFITSESHDSTKQDKLISGTNIKTINNQDILGSGNIEIGENYTTEEQIIGRWIDGKPIYRIIIDTTVGQANNAMSSLNIDYLISTEGSWALSRYNNSWMIPNFHSEQGYSIFLIGGEPLGRFSEISFGSYFPNNSPVKLILEYTKTTD